MNKGILRHLFTLLIIFSPFFSSGYTNGDYGSPTTAGPWNWAGGTAQWYSYAGVTGTWNGAWTALALGTAPSALKTVWIRSGCNMLLNAAGTCKNVTVEAGAQLYAGASTNTLTVDGTFITDSGTIGNTGATDGIIFSVDNVSGGANCTISGPGYFEAYQITKNSATNPTNLFISMNIRLVCNGAAPTADIYNNAAKAFNVTFSNGTIDSLWSYGAPVGNLSINGPAGNSTTAWGTFTVNNTLIIADTLYLTSTHPTKACSFVINDTVQTYYINNAPSAAGTFSVTLNSASLLEIMGTANGGNWGSFNPGSNNIFSLTNNYIEYGGSGNQIIDTNISPTPPMGALGYRFLTLGGSGTKTFSSTTLFISKSLLINSGVTLSVSTNVDIQGNWTDNGTFSGAGSTVTFEGNTNQTMTFPASENFDNLIINDKATTSVAGNSLSISGNLLINSSSTLSDPTNILIQGNWTDGGTFSGAGSTVTFNGSANQTMIDSSGNGENFYNVVMNQSTGLNEVILDAATSSKMNIATSLTLTTGIIMADITNSGGNYVAFASGATVSGANDNSFVNGRVAETGSTGFTFPVGKGAEYRPIAVGATGASTTFYAQYFHVDPDNATVVTNYPTDQVDAPIDSVSRCEYWTLESTSAVTDNITLSWDTYSCGVTDPSSLLVAMDSTSASYWSSLGHASTTGNATQGTVTASTSMFFTANQTYALTLADTSLANPLPVSLLSFTAKPEQSNVLVTWSTASEINDDYFTIEKTADGTDFVKVGVVKGAGTSTSEINYSLIDSTPFPGVSYYRLKQTDFNGHSTYSQLAPVSFTMQISRSFTIYPNPTADKAYFNLTTPTNQQTNTNQKTYTLRVFDVSGREVMPSQILNFSIGSLQTLDVSLLPKGVYELQLIGDTDSQQTSLVKE